MSVGTDSGGMMRTLRAAREREDDNDIHQDELTSLYPYGLLSTVRYFGWVWFISTKHHVHNGTRVGQKFGASLRSCSTRRPSLRSGLE